jgi:hypothetical protein
MENLKIAYVDPFPGRKGSERIYETCPKCSGSGVVNWGNVTFVARGREDRHCFDCGGTGKTSALVSSLRATARRRAKVDAEAAAAWAAGEALRESWKAAGYGELLAELETALQGLRHGDPLRRAVETAREAMNLFAATEADAAAAREALDAIAAREAAAVPVVEGRHELEGEIVGVKLHESAYGSSWKMVLAAEAGYKVWLTIPEALWTQLSAEAGEDVNVAAEAFRGRRVRLTATVEASQDDKAFGFGKRPSKATLLPAEAE